MTTDKIAEREAEVRAAIAAALSSTERTDAHVAELQAENERLRSYLAEARDALIAAPRRYFVLIIIVFLGAFALGGLIVYFTVFTIFEAVESALPSFGHGG